MGPIETVPQGEFWSNNQTSQKNLSKFVGVSCARSHMRNWVPCPGHSLAVWVATGVCHARVFVLVSVCISWDSELLVCWIFVTQLVLLARYIPWCSDTVAARRILLAVLIGFKRFLCFHFCTCENSFHGPSTSVSPVCSCICFTAGTAWKELTCMPSSLLGKMDVYLHIQAYK